MKNASNSVHAYWRVLYKQHTSSDFSSPSHSCRGHALRVFDTLVFVARRAALSAKVLLFLFLLLPALGLELDLRRRLDLWPARHVPPLDLLGDAALLLKVRLVVAVVHDELAVLDGEDRVGGLRDEEAVVRHHEHRALELLQRLLEHLLGGDVEVVGRLVEQQHLRLLQQRLAEPDPHLPPAREGGHRQLGVRRGESHRTHHPLGALLDGARVGRVQLRLQLRHRVERALHRVGVLACGGERRLRLVVPRAEREHLRKDGEHLVPQRAVVAELLAELLPQKGNLDVRR
mmetsp:Transcript_23420/g.69516  ORF Transcript_23420/g.69516 Transcript_23420/m.69516 type:complete len:288 (-) Transcript_23420:414-1277(-)